MDERSSWDVSQLIGKSEADAVEVLRAYRVVDFRVIHIGRSEWHTSDQRLQRLTLEVEGDIVRSAEFY